MSKTSSASKAASGKDAYEPRLLTLYREEICKQMTRELGYANPMQVPRLTKVVLSMGVGRAVADSKKIRTALADLAAISGQKPIATQARKSIAGFKLREGMSIGAKVTLRRVRMYEFLDRLVNVALPRVKDFRGLSRSSFDGLGNFSFGLREHIVFPEINYDQVDQIWGLNVALATSARTDKEAEMLLAGFGLPFQKQQGQK